MLSILDLSSDSIREVAPMAMSTVSLTPPIVDAPALENQPPTLMAAGPDGVKHSLCRPGSAAVKVNFEYVSEEVVVCVTTRWSLSKTSSTVTWMDRSPVVWKDWVWGE
jgi:hypothetical protein